MTLAKVEVNGRVVSTNLKTDSIGSIMPDCLCYETWISNYGEGKPCKVAHCLAEARENQQWAVNFAKFELP